MSPANTPLHILVANTVLDGRTGTECVVRDLAGGLVRLGHDVTVYSPRLGAIADEIAAAGARVVASLDDVAGVPDVVHGHHHATTVEALLRFPCVTGLFVCHDRLAATDVPPLFARIARYVAVDDNCLERLRCYAIPTDQIEVVRNAVDLERFVMRDTLPASPRRAAVFGNAAEERFSVAPIRAACAARGIELDVIGTGAGTPVTHPEHVLGGYDVVFAKARCALEAMAVGAAVVLCDQRGMGPLVTSRDVAELRRWNFGMRVLDRPIDADALARELGRYDAVDAAAVRDFVRADAALDAAVARYLDLYAACIAARSPPDGDELRQYLERQLKAACTVDETIRGHAMYALPQAQLSHVAFTSEACPSPIAAGSTHSLSIELRNDSAWRLASEAPYPVNATYRWRRLEDGAIEVADGMRTPLLPWIEPGERRALGMLIEAPARAGRYRLEATLVQEGVAWFDLVDASVGAHHVVDVTS